MKPFFSVIIPSYNRSETILRSVKSVLDQSFKHFELIVVDDGSTDDTLIKLTPYLDQIKLIKLDTNQGVSFARNVAIKASQADWVAFLDSDDEWLKDKLLKQYDYIQSNPQYKAVHANERWIRKGVRVNAKKIHQKGGGDQFARSCQLCIISPSCVVIKRDVLIELGLFREDYPVCEDYDLWLKLTAKYEIGFIEEELIIKYGGHADQLSHKFKAMDWYRFQSLVWMINNADLSQENREAAIKQANVKYNVLKLGYLKHNQTQALESLTKLYMSLTEFMS
jgi:glycosyltransferase involved in cell wall biosynthesis